MSLSAMIRKRQFGESATATVATPATVRTKPPLTVATVATVAVANPQAVKADNSEACSGWLFHFIDRDDLPVTFAPAVDHAKALSYYPEAVAAEPIPDRPQRNPTQAEAEEITALINAILPDDNDNDVDRSEALAAGPADPDGALLCYRTIAEDQGIAIAAPVVEAAKACRDCQHFSGLGAGYCCGRDDLPLAYGENHPLRQLPVDRGASCNSWLAIK